jgi:hypothetical protein
MKEREKDLDQRLHAVIDALRGKLFFLYGAFICFQNVAADSDFLLCLDQPLLVLMPNAPTTRQRAMWLAVSGWLNVLAPASRTCWRRYN